jgi:hypothetical protein
MKLKWNLRTPILATAVMATWLCAPASAAGIENLHSRNGQQLGITLSHYKYEEPDFMSLEALKLGVDYSSTLMLDSAWFMRLDGRYATGDADYESAGTGTADNIPDWYAEIRTLFGKDYDLANSVLAPYSGLGYRYLFNDLRGDTSTGSIGYRRESQYFYLPLGAIHRMALSDTAKLETTLELDYLLQGKQSSHFEDLAGHGNVTYGQEIKNKQDQGYGIRISSQYQQGSWGIGPYLMYWNIEDSDQVNSIIADDQYYYSISGMEPANNTLEFGLKGSYLF